MNTIAPEKNRQLEKLLRDGVSLRDASKEVGVSKGTVQRLRRELGLSSPTEGETPSPEIAESEPIAGMKPIYCKCGCGEQTNAKHMRVLRLRGQGLTYKEIGRELGIADSTAKSYVLYPPPQFILGHSSRYYAEQGNYRRCANCGRRFRGSKKRYCWRADSGCRELHYEEHRLQARREPIIVAKQVRQWRAASARQQFLSEVRAERSKRFAARRRLRDAERRANRERDQETIEWLRNQVGLGWQRDKSWDLNLQSLEGLDFRKESSNADWVAAKDADPEIILQRRIEKKVANLLVASGDPLVLRAITDPETLDDEDRSRLQEMFELVESAEFSNRIPDLAVAS